MSHRRLFSIFGITIVLVCFLFNHPGAARAEQALPVEPMVDQIKIEIAGGTLERQKKLREMAREIIRVKPGTEFSEKALLLSIELLAQTGRFSKIDVPDQDWEADAIDLVFKLTPILLIHDIQVSGSFPVFRDEVIDATDYVSGKAFHADHHEKNIKAVETLLKENGYIDPVVKITTDRVEDLEVSVWIDIDKSAYLKISQIEFNGNHTFSDTRLKMRMKSYQMPLIFWRDGKRSISGNLKKDMKRLLAFYREKGFADAKISHRLEKVQGEHTLGLFIDVDEGPQYRVAFSGNEAFWNYTLKKDLILKTKGNANDFGLKKSVKNMHKRYVQAGYPECTIDYTSQIVEDGGRQFRDIHFMFKENTRYLVRSSTIDGSESIDPDALMNEILTREKSFLYSGAYVKDKLEDDPRALENFYDSRGYVDTQVKTDINWEEENEEGVKYADVKFHVAEGYQKTVATVELLGVSSAFEKEIRQVMDTKAGTPFIRSSVQKDRQAILTYLAEKGHIYASVDPQVDPGQGKEGVAIVFNIDKKSLASAGGVWAFGNLRTKDEILLRHNKIKMDEPVALFNFVDLQKDIRNLNCIERADFKVVGIQENEERLFFIADVEERKPYYLETGIGYDTKRDAYLAISLGDRNFQGKNRELYFNAEVSGIGYETALGIKEFDFLSRHILAELSIFASEEELKNQTFGSRTYGTKLALEKELFSYLKVGVSSGLEFKEQYEVGTTQENSSDIFDTRGIVTVTPFVTWNSVDSFVKPTKGFYVNASSGYNKDILEDLDHFVKYRLKVKYYYQPFSSLVLAFQGMYGYIHNLSDTSKLPDDQLFFLGGISDVRGFDENELITDSFGDPVGGKTQIAGSIEARIELGSHFEIPVFLDAGSIRDTGVSGASEDFKFTIGSGLRYMTPVGPVGLLYGYKLNPENGEESGRVHFSIGYTF